MTNTNPLSGTRLTDDTRGQLMLMAAIVVAISLVVLVVALNTVLYSANLESRDATPSLDLADGYVKTLESEYTTVINSQNTNNYTSKATAADNTTAALLETNQLVAAQYAESQGVYATIDPIRMTNATVIQQTNAVCTFESADADCAGENPPVASFTISSNPATVGNNVTFDGSGSSDNSSIESYEWDFDGDGTTDATGVNPETSFSDSGVYEVTLTVTDDQGNTATHQKHLEVEDSDGDTAPSAAFTYSPSNPSPNDTLMFDASASSDPDNDIQSYEWDFTSDGTVDATGETASHSYSSGGEYTVTLTVTDSDGLTTTTQKTISVTDNGSGMPFSISQPPVGQSQGGGSTTDWTLVEETSRVRNFQFNVQKADLGKALNKSDISQSFLRDDSFYVRIEGETDIQRIYIFQSEKDEIVVASQINDNDITVHYSSSAQNAEIDLTTGRINGKQMSLVFADSLNGPYEISFRNGGVAAGTYRLVVPNDTPDTTDIERGNFNKAPNTNSPYLSLGVYSVRVRVTFDMNGISYQTTKFIAPDEPERFNP